MTTFLPTGRLRLGVAAAMLALAMPAHALTFISPMGEPFRAPAGEKAPEEVWFERADANNDGKITLAEFITDAGRFFRVLDINHDGRIEDEEIQHYEDDIAPETLGGVGDMPADEAAGGHGGHHGGRGSGSRRGRVSHDTAVAADEDNVTDTYLKPEDRYDAANVGAARFSYLDLPEPVAAADVNFDRCVSPREYVDAARVRFDALDANHDGTLTRDELPHLGGAHFSYRPQDHGQDRPHHRGGGER